MDRVQLTFVVLFNFISLSKYVLGEAVAYFPSETRAVNQFEAIHPYYGPVSRYSMPEYRWPQQRVFPEQIITKDQMLSEHMTPILHKAAADLNPPIVPEEPMEGLNYTSGRDEQIILRAAKPGYGYPTHPASSYPSAPSYSYTAPSTGYSPPASSPGYSAPASPASGYKPPAPSSYVPASSSAPSYAPTPSLPTDKFPLLKPDLTSLIKPVTTKVATKVSGLIGLILSLLTGTAPDDLEMKGFKDIIINGIVRPLLIAKGGIKSLISKLTIPVISLLLINLEVLVTVWWLWEECPESSKPTYTPPAYTPTYNSYR